MEYKPEELVSLMSSLINGLSDPEITKYKRKLANAYINTVVQIVHSEEPSLKNKFLHVMCMMAVILQVNREDSFQAVPEDIFKKVTNDILAYLCAKEISRIRAIIIDLHAGSYTGNQEYRAKQEDWATKIVVEILALIPQNALRSQCFQEPAKTLIAMLYKQLTQEIKEAFTSKAQPFGKRANQLVLNILYISKQLKPYALQEDTDKLVEEIRSRFKDKSQAMPTEELAKFLK